MDKKEFKKELKILRKLVKKGNCTGFVGYGYMPICHPDFRISIMKQMGICMQYEPFVEKLRNDIFGDEE